MTFEKEKQEFFECECKGEIVRLVYYPDYGDVNLSVFHYANSRSGLWHKIRHCWHIIRYGSPYDDDVSFDISEARKIRDFLSKILRNIEK